VSAGYRGPRNRNFPRGGGKQGLSAFAVIKNMAANKRSFHHLQQWKTPIDRVPLVPEEEELFHPDRPEMHLWHVKLY